MANKANYRDYSSVSDDDESRKSFIDSEAVRLMTPPTWRTKFISYFSKGYNILLHVVLIATYALLAITWVKKPGEGYHGGVAEGFSSESSRFCLLLVLNYLLIRYSSADGCPSRIQ